MPITIQKAEKEAQLTLNGIQLDKGSFARMKSLEKAYIANGYPPAKLHVGYVPYHKGVAYCSHCQHAVKDVPTHHFNGHDFWRCGKCAKMNYIN